MLRNANISIWDNDKFKSTVYDTKAINNNSYMKCCMEIVTMFPGELLVRVEAIRNNDGQLVIVNDKYELGSDEYSRLQELFEYIIDGRASLIEYGGGLMTVHHTFDLENNEYLNKYEYVILSDEWYSDDNELLEMSRLRFQIVNKLNHSIINDINFGIFSGIAGVLHSYSNESIDLKELVELNISLDRLSNGNIRLGIEGIHIDRNTSVPVQPIDVMITEADEDIYTIFNGLDQITDVPVSMNICLDMHSVSISNYNPNTNGEVLLSFNTPYTIFNLSKGE